MSPRISEGLGDPTPADIVQEGVIDEVGLEIGAGEDDGAERAVPLVDAVGIVEKDETPAARAVVRVAGLRGERHGRRGEALRGGRLVDFELRADTDGLDLSEGPLEGIRP